MFDLNPDEAQLLLNIAMMAIGSNRFSSASQVLVALEEFRPDHPSIMATKTLALINALQLDVALAYLDNEALVKAPDSAMLKALKGMVLIRLDRASEAKAPLQEAASQTQDSAAATLAKGLLNE